MEIVCKGIRGINMGAKRGKKRTNFDVEDSGYHPTKEELEMDVSIDARPEAVVRALFSPDPPLVESGKGEQVKKEWTAWLKSRGI